MRVCFADVKAGLFEKTKLLEDLLNLTGQKVEIEFVILAQDTVGLSLQGHAHRFIWKP